MDDIDEPPDLPKYTPTPEQIRQVCLEIQAGWTADEELRRRAVGPNRDICVDRPVRVGTW